MQPKTRRTPTDYSRHEFTVHLDCEVGDTTCACYRLKLPDSGVHMVEILCFRGRTLVMGDFGEWVFNKEFHPSAKENAGVSDGYWLDKMYGESGATGVKFDSDATIAEIDEMLNPEWQTEHIDRQFTEEEIEYLEACKEAAWDSEFVYDSVAYRQNVGYFEDHEAIPRVIKTKYWLLAVFDAFDEMCARLKNNSK